jgi:hypothetical protein
MVQIYVEDSGLRKFQESLDRTHSIKALFRDWAVCVCQNLIDLMHGEISLDDKYESGIEGFPGFRFVIKLNTPAIVLDAIDLETNEWSMDTQYQPHPG